MMVGVMSLCIVPAGTNTTICEQSFIHAAGVCTVGLLSNDIDTGRFIYLVSILLCCGIRFGEGTVIGTSG